MGDILNEEQQEFQETKVWKPMPEDHKLFIICALLSAAMILFGILMVWGKTAAAVVGVMIIILAIYTHFKLQKKLKLEKAIFYQDRGEMFVIFLNRGDEELAKYLQGGLEVDKAKNPGDILCDLAEWSVICHIRAIHKIFEKKEKKFMLYTSYDLVPYPCYEGTMGIPVKEKCFENFDELMKLAYFKKIDL